MPDLHPHFISELHIHLASSVTSSIHSSDPAPLEACMPIQSLCCMLGIMSCSKCSPYFFLPIIQVDLSFIHPKNGFPKLVWIFFRFFSFLNLCGLFYSWGLWIVCTLQFFFSECTNPNCSLGAVEKNAFPFFTT